MAPVTLVYFCYGWTLWLFLSWNLPFVGSMVLMLLGAVMAFAMRPATLAPLPPVVVYRSGPSRTSLNGHFGTLDHRNSLPASRHFIADGASRRALWV